MPSASIFAISIAKIRKSREKQKEKVENLCLCEEEYIPLRQIQLYLFMKIFSILTRKYPYPQNRLWLRDSAVYCTIVFLILYLLQPFGFSMYHGNKLLVSLLFGIVTFACCYIFGLVFVPLQKRISPWRIWHEVCSTLVMIFISIPSFVLISFVLSIFCYSLNWLPSTWPADTAPLAAKIRGYIIPVFCLSFGSICYYCRYTRAELCEVMESDYLLLARTKGLTRRQAIIRHALKNAMVPIFPAILSEFIGILGGSMILESMYGIPGIGKLFVLALNYKDYDILFVDMAIFTTISLLAGVVLDLSYGFIDPRIRMGAKK